MTSKETLDRVSLDRKEEREKEMRSDAGQKQCLGFPCDDLLGQGAVDPIANLNNRHSLDRQGVFSVVLIESIVYFYTVVAWRSS